MHNERCTSGSEGGLEKPTGRKTGRALQSDPTGIDQGGITGRRRPFRQSSVLKNRDRP